MANLPETATYDAGVIQLETTTPVEGGADGASNAPLKNLANRTTWLKAHVDDLESGVTIPPTVAPKNSPEFTGSPTAPNVAAGDRSTKVANTNFVQTAANGLSSINVAGGDNVTLTAAQYGNRILVLTGILTANIALIFPALSGKWIVVNNTTGSFTVTCRTAAGTGIVVTQGKSRNLHGDATNIYDERTDFEAVAITGDATAKTQDAADSSTKIATTSFVQAAIAALLAAGNYLRATVTAVLSKGFFNTTVPLSISSGEVTFVMTDGNVQRIANVNADFTLNFPAAVPGAGMVTIYAQQDATGRVMTLDSGFRLSAGEWSTDPDVMNMIFISAEAASATILDVWIAQRPTS